MQHVKQTTAAEPPAGRFDDDTYFDLQAKMGLTKHIGGAAVTDELVALCHLAPEMRVLDVGCGVGLTALNLVRRLNVHVVGVDLRPAMVARAMEYAREEGISDRAVFRTADAQALPFEDNTFDAVLCESVLVFVPDPARALREFVRVVKPGGWVGYTEAYWKGGPQHAALRARVPFPLGTHDAWVALLNDGGLVDTIARPHDIGGLREDAGRQIRRIGLGRMLRAYWRVLGMMFQARFRRFMGDALHTPLDVVGVMGYGVYAGRKPA